MTERERLEKAGLDLVFEMMVSAARNGLRCPENLDIADALCKKNLPYTFFDRLVKKSKRSSNGVVVLSRQGRITTYIYGKNWRVVEIEEGPHTGKRTLACPHAKTASRVIHKKDE